MKVHEVVLGPCISSTKIMHRLGEVVLSLNSIYIKKHLGDFYENSDRDGILELHNSDYEKCDEMDCLGQKAKTRARGFIFIRDQHPSENVAYVIHHVMSNLWWVDYIVIFSRDWSWEGIPTIEDLKQS